MTPIGSLAVVFYGLGTAVLMAAGNFFQKLNGQRGASPLFSVWVVSATLCYLPTFFLANWVYSRGGRASLFVPMSAVTYVLTVALAHAWFGEPVSIGQMIGCGAVIAGVALIARG